MSQYLKRIEIANMGAAEEELQSQYLKRVHIVEMVDSDGNPWEPVPGPDPFDELVVATGATWSESNVYEIGEDIAGTGATYVGGTGNEIYRSRVQHRSVTDTDWNNTPWTEHLNVPAVVHFVIPDSEANGSVRFQTQARDTTQDPVVQKNSFASIRQIAPLQWGAITTEINDQPYDANDGSYACSVNTPQHCEVIVANAPSDLTYEWTRRGSDNVLIGTPTSNITTITFPESGIFTITVSLRSNQTEAWESAILTFIVA